MRSWDKYTDLMERMDSVIYRLNVLSESNDLLWKKVAQKQREADKRFKILLGLIGLLVIPAAYFIVS